MSKEKRSLIVDKLIGKGNTAEVYTVKDNEQYVLKLFCKSIPLEVIEKEYEISRLINQLAFKSPKAVEIVNLHGKWGIVYEKIVGIPFTQLLSKQPYLLRKHAKEFAKLHASFHGIFTNQLTSQKKYLYRSISGTQLLNVAEKELILTYLNNLPEDNKVCHGDYHTDNIIVMNGKPIVLDWMTGTAGNPCGDVARTLMIMKYSYLPRGMPKTTKFLIQFVRKAFARTYLKTYLNITKESEESIKKWLLPVMAARLVEDVPQPEKQFLLKEVKNLLGKIT